MFSIEAIPCLTALPLQARLGLLFLFLLFLAFLANLSPSGNNAVSSRLGLVAASRFAHNWLTRLQQGLPGASVVSVFLTRLSKPHTGPHRAEFGFIIFFF